jgi:multiple sugar transport system ATP-binding protein
LRAALEEDETLLPDERAMFTARVDPATSARPGQRLRLAVDASKFHFFDPETGARLDPAPEPALA